MGIVVIRTGDFGRRLFFFTAGAGSVAEFFLLSLPNIFRGSSRPSESSDSSESSSPSELGITLVCFWVVCEPGIEEDGIDAPENELLADVWAAGDESRDRRVFVDGLRLLVLFAARRRGRCCVGGEEATAMVLVS